VYAALNATPDDGQRFSAAVRLALEREARVVAWKSTQVEVEQVRPVGGA
jgi:hypothetical protein